MVDFTPPGSTINAAAYQKTLKKLKEAIWKKRPGFFTTGVLLWHYYARPFSAATTVNLLKSWCWGILPHSPDLALSDFHLSPKTNEHLRGQLFHSNEDVQNEVKKWLRA
jgi:hypothetical protein